MTLQELKQTLKKDDRIPEYCYSIDKPKEEALGIMQKGDAWIIYGCEKGVVFPIEQFSSETEACEAFFEEIKLMLHL